jgi:hypothetical protein
MSDAKVYSDRGLGLQLGWILKLGRKYDIPCIEVIKGFLKPPQDILFDLRMDGIEVRIGLFLKDRSSLPLYSNKIKCTVPESGQ